MKMRYSETQQKMILREMERDILALVAVDLESGDFEVIYSDGAYRNYDDLSVRHDFFSAWQTVGVSLVYEEDRMKAKEILNRDYLVSKLANGQDFYTVLRFIVDGKPAYCRIKVAESQFEEGTIVISIRNIDREIRQEMENLARMEEVHRKESVYREAILASSSGFMEIDLTKDRVVAGLNHSEVEWIPECEEHKVTKNEYSYIDLLHWRADHILLSDREEYLKFSDESHLIECYSAGKRVLNIEFKARTKEGGSSIFRETYYISKDEMTEDVMAMCVLYDMTQQKKSERDVLQLRETLKQMRMKNFISQMHPHFLYNALSSIREIVLTDPEYGADMLYDFTTHLRASIRAMSNDEKIWFSQELENIKAYVSIEKMRFGERLKVLYDIGTMDFQIIPLSIQPIVENAIKHGIYEKVDGGTVCLKTWETDTTWEISVVDEGTGFDPIAVKREVEDGGRDSTGLSNLIFRLENMMDADVEILSEVGKGTTVLIHIPKSTM
ncbi:MAG: histidine kinase [Oscillospiraceae bacterium]|nr:histidine kinase [Oscillospiraceae bacterium]